MKKAFFALLVLASCSKEPLQDPAPKSVPTPPEQCMAATFYYDDYEDTTWRKKTGTTIWHHHKVCGSLLESYKALPPDMQICREPRRQRVVIHIDNCKPL